MDRREWSPYQAADRAGDGEHPVDLEVHRRLPQEEARAKIRRLSDRLMEALGDERELWLELEALLNDYRCNREEVYFDVGYERGCARGVIDILRSVVPTVLTRRCCPFRCTGGTRNCSQGS